jgi:plasmid stabilization system protein ParE
MIRKLEFTPEARDDVRQAYGWYERHSLGLGDRFLLHVEECLGYIQANSELFEVAYKHYRRAIVRRYPYVIFYAFSGDAVTVHAVFHSAQSPRKWRQRLP